MKGDTFSKPSFLGIYINVKFRGCMNPFHFKPTQHLPKKYLPPLECAARGDVPKDLPVQPGVIFNKQKPKVELSFWRGGNYDKLTDTKTEMAIKCQQTWPLILGRFAPAMHLLKYTLRISRLWGPRWTQPWMAPTPLLPLGDPSFRWFLHFITRNSKQNLVTWLYNG